MSPRTSWKEWKITEGEGTGRGKDGELQLLLDTRLSICHKEEWVDKGG